MGNTLELLYSVRMRAAQGGDHAQGGRHISGAERLVGTADLARVTNMMLMRALYHSRGRADFINIAVEQIAANTIRKIPLLPVTTIAAPDVVSGRKAALDFLTKAGVNPAAAYRGLTALTKLPESMRGAMLMSAKTGERLDQTGERGIRVSRMDVTDEDAFISFLTENGLSGTHVREALVLAAKVVSAPGVLAELCWSDDPEYTAGYVACANGYFRFPHLKEYGTAVGGRVFFIQPDCDLTMLTDYLQKQPVLVTIAERRDQNGMADRIS